MEDDHTLEERIRKRAYDLWRDDGSPNGRADFYWAQAKAIVALEMGAGDLMTKSSEPPGPEPIEAVLNQGEFPTLTDQGEEQSYPRPPDRQNELQKDD